MWCDVTVNSINSATATAIAIAIGGSGCDCGSEECIVQMGINVKGISKK
ncbi:hypothetical protein LOAG_10154 [Loa loa]|uniref:Uncharacterized protein n=1 Tax=Loa loa TaxID=7209 RepID=A0A1S0TQA3_LOALO|nr:hypothetical protein LOAG_10154 [Loa loa]EFO18341.1 hypothetical protein LOAG_10154 [Loa loa]